MYHYTIHRKLLAAFEEINKGNYEAILNQFHPNAEHWFSGESALGSARHTPEGIRKWYQRLKIVLPGLTFKIKQISISGWPWNTVATVEWQDSFHMPNGEDRSNEGVHIFNLKWGKVSSMHIYCDTLKLSQTLEFVAEQGVSEAIAPPITD